MGENAQISKGFITEFGFDLYIGNNFIAGHHLKMIDCNVITIGNNVTVGEEVILLTMLLMCLKEHNIGVVKAQSLLVTT